MLLWKMKHLGACSLRVQRAIWLQIHFQQCWLSIDGQKDELKLSLVAEKRDRSSQVHPQATACSIFSFFLPETSKRVPNHGSRSVGSTVQDPHCYRLSGTSIQASHLTTQHSVYVIRQGINKYNYRFKSSCTGGQFRKWDAPDASWMLGNNPGVGASRRGQVIYPMGLLTKWSTLICFPSGRESLSRNTSSKPFSNHFSISVPSQTSY